MQRTVAERRGPGRSLAAALALGLAAGVPAAQETPSALEYQVKAAFLYNFARFVEWPAGPTDRSASRFVIGVLAQETFTRTLEQAVREKTLDGRPFEVRRLKSLDEAAACQMLYLGAEESARLASLPGWVRGTAVLTVGDAHAFIQQGGIINFVIEDNRVRFQINPEAAERAGLRISSKLLQLATIVRDVARVENKE